MFAFLARKNGGAVLRAESCIGGIAKGQFLKLNDADFG